MTKENQSKLIYRLKLAVLVALIYLILNIFGMGCPIKYFTGISCPGCGMTRAVLSAMHLDFSRALYFHPLVILVPFMFVMYLFGDILKPQHVKIFWVDITIIFMVVYIFRLLSTHNDVVSIDINNGIVVRFIHNNILGG